MLLVALTHSMASSAGPLVDTPEFKAEEHIGPGLTSLCALLSFLAHTLAMLPGLVAAFAIMGEWLCTWTFPSQLLLR